MKCAASSTLISSQIPNTHLRTLFSIRVAFNMKKLGFFCNAGKLCRLKHPTWRSIPQDSIFTLIIRSFLRVRNHVEHPHKQIKYLRGVGSFFGKPTGPQPVKEFAAFYGTCSLPHTQAPTNWPSSKPDESSPHSQILFINDKFLYFLPIYA